MKYTKEMLLAVVPNSKSISEVLRTLGVSENGGTRSTVKHSIEKFHIDVSHFTGRGYMKGKPAKNRLHWKDILVLRPKSYGREEAVRLRRALIEIGREYKCESCQRNPEWMGKELRLAVDHKDGNWSNNVAKNLRFLCPNCHSQTPNFCGSMGLTDVSSATRYYNHRYKQNMGR